jgi:hypothetical protein
MRSFMVSCAVIVKEIVAAHLPLATHAQKGSHGSRARLVLQATLEHLSQNFRGQR